MFLPRCVAKPPAGCGHDHQERELNCRFGAAGAAEEGPDISLLERAAL
jgi:hypothetical protein